MLEYLSYSERRWGVRPLHRAAKVWHGRAIFKLFKHFREPLFEVLPPVPDEDGQQGPHLSHLPTGVSTHHPAGYVQTLEM